MNVLSEETTQRASHCGQRSVADSSLITSFASFGKNNRTNFWGLQASTTMIGRELSNNIVLQTDAIVLRPLFQMIYDHLSKGT